MNSEKNYKRATLYLWLKRISAILAVTIWFALIIHIFQGGGGMSKQAPKCIFTTMITFGILSAIYKGIEILEEKEKD